jgi:hypothetical protein
MNTIVITDDGTKKTSELIANLKALFHVWSYFSDSDLDRDFPPVKTSRSFKNVQEADEELKNKSAEDLQRQGIECITLRERLIMELLYFKETGKHLDVDNITLCAGSRAQRGGVPGVRWDGDDGELSVFWYYPQFASGRLRARAAVSLVTPPLIPSDLETRVKRLEDAVFRVAKKRGRPRKIA